MNGYYTFILKRGEGEKCCIVPTTLFEYEYAPLEKETYVFFTFNCEAKDEKKD